MNIEEVYNHLIKFIKKSRIKKNVNMARYTSFKAGGEASLMVTPKTEEELSNTMKVILEEGCESFTMGNGTNLLVRDGGFDGVMVRISEYFSNITVEGTYIKAQSGALLTAVARVALNNSLTGFEFASGIPGSVGGAAAMNGGAYGGEIKDIIVEAKVMDKQGNIFTMTKEEMDLGYRRSAMQTNHYIVLEAKFKLEEGDKNVIKDRMRALNKQRNEKQPVQLPSAGSFFKRPEGHFAGKLIEDASLKGLTLGGAQVSDLHAGFIVNIGNATATDIINLMALVQTTVMDQSGVLLEPEVKIIGKL